MAGYRESDCFGGLVGSAVSRPRRHGLGLTTRASLSRDRGIIGVPACRPVEGIRMETMVLHPSHRLLYIKVRAQTIVDREGSLYEAVR